MHPIDKIIKESFIIKMDAQILMTKWLYFIILSHFGINPTGYFDSRSEFSMVIRDCILTKVVYNHGLT